MRHNGFEVEEPEDPALEPPEDHRPFQRVLRSRMTVAEKLLWDHLKARKLDGLKFRRQQRVGNYIVDFYCAEFRLVVELDGAAHENREEYDAMREASLRAMGLEVVRFRNEEVLDHWERVLKAISRAAGGRQRFRY